MSIQLTTSEIQQTEQLLQGEQYAPEVIEMLAKYDGNLDNCFDAMWITKNEPQMLNLAASQRPSLWEVTQEVLRNELCSNEGFRGKIMDYNKNPGSAALFTGAIVYVAQLTTLPINPAIATIIVLYIIKVGIDIFCKYTEPVK